VNEQVALTTVAVTRALAEKDVLYLKGDWTRHDPAIARELERHGRSGVPLYLLYAPGAESPRVLPQVLTESMVLDNLANL
jgi:thiol:disulfide interchange protein DsbD